MEDLAPQRRDASSFQRKREKDFVRAERQGIAQLRRRGGAVRPPKKRQQARKAARRSGPAVSKAARKALHSRFRRRLAQFAESEAYVQAGSPEKGDPGLGDPATPGRGLGEAESSPGARGATATPGTGSPHTPRGIDAFLDAIARANAASGSARRGMEDRVSRAVFSGLFGAGARAAAAAVRHAASFSLLDSDQAAMTPSFEQALVDVLREALFGARGVGAVAADGAVSHQADMFRPWQDYVHAGTVRALVEGMPAESPGSGPSPRAALLRAVYAQRPALRGPLARTLAENVVAFAALGAAKCIEADEEEGVALGSVPGSARPLRDAAAPPRLRLAPWLDLAYSLVPRLAEEAHEAAHAPEGDCAMQEEDDEGDEDEDEDDEGYGSTCGLRQRRLAAVQRRAEAFAWLVTAAARAPNVCAALCARVTATAVALARACPGVAAAGVLHRLLAKWPRADGTHEGALLALLTEVLSALPLAALAHVAPRTHGMLLRRIQRCVVSPNAQVARRALELCGRPELVLPLHSRTPEALKALTAAVHEASKAHWDADTRAAADAAFDQLLDLAAES